MRPKELVRLDVICQSYEIESSLVEEIHQAGYIQLYYERKTAYLRQDELGQLEKIANMKRELGINQEGIETVLHLLRRIERLQSEMSEIRNRLLLYERED